MQTRTSLRGLPIFATVVAGVLAGHQLTYLLIHPGADDLHASLERSGHDYLPLAGRLAIALALAGLLTLLWRALSHGPTGSSDPAGAPGRLAARLWAVQVAVFLTAEVLERLVAGAPIGDLATTGIVPAGLVALAATAAVGALLLRWLDRAVEAVIAAIRRSTGPWNAARPLPPVLASVVPGSPLSGAAGVRGPPLALPR
jgi:hypothetical protein